jgi:hypothetical protein
MLQFAFLRVAVRPLVICCLTACQPLLDLMSAAGCPLDNCCVTCCQLLCSLPLAVVRPPVSRCLTSCQWLFCLLSAVVRPRVRWYFAPGRLLFDLLSVVARLLANIIWRHLVKRGPTCGDPYSLLCVDQPLCNTLRQVIYGDTLHVALGRGGGIARRCLNWIPTNVTLGYGEVLTRGWQHFPDKSTTARHVVRWYCRAALLIGCRTCGSARASLCVLHVSTLVVTCSHDYSWE